MESVGNKDGRLFNQPRQEVSASEDAYTRYQQMKHPPERKDTLHTNATWNNEVGYGLVDATAAVEMAKRESSVTTYIRNKVFDNEDVELHRDKYVEIEHVRVDSGGLLHIDEEKRAILKSSVRIKKGGYFTIYNVSEE